MSRLKNRLASNRQSSKSWLQRPFSRGPECKSPEAHDTQHADQVEPSVPDPEPEPEPEHEHEHEPEPERPQTIWNSPLESLPAEIRHHILYSMEYDGLKPLVRASPVYHQQYLLDRERLLCACLERSLGSRTIDACAVYDSGWFDFAKTRNQETVRQFLESYQGRYQFEPLKSCTFDQLISMAHFHSLVCDIARQYTGWALANLTEETTPQNHASLSKTEEARIVRGLYRFELYCNLFGSSNHKTNLHLSLDFEGEEVLRIFMGNYKPWEIEEIACIYAFVQTKLNQVFDDIYEDVHPDNPRSKVRWWPVPPDGAFDFDWKEKRESLLEGTITRGLHLLHHILFNIKDHDHLVSTMQKEISNPRSNFFEKIMHVRTQRTRFRLHPSNQDMEQERRIPLPFQGDSDDLPPLTWTMIWQGIYSNRFGGYIEQPMRLWGYIMWDAARVENTGAREVLKRQWRICWE